MADERLRRRLAAILSADVVGYSRLMSIDEAGTLSRLNALRRELIDPAIAAHCGRIVKLMGDGALVEFASAVDAVTCAIEIQRRLREREAGVLEADTIWFRIGINVGDIIIEGDDILGDGVNIAARIEGIAEPGGISISEDAWRQVQGKVAANFVDAGEQSLKNIARPVRVYRVELGEGAKRPSSDQLLGIAQPARPTHSNSLGGKGAATGFGLLPSGVSLSRFVPYVAVPVILLLLAHYLIVISLDTDLNYLRGVAVMVPLACGFLLFRRLRISVVGAGLLGLAIAILAVFGMTTIVGFVDGHSILPASKAEWQESFEYLITVTLATAAGNGVAWIASSAMPRKSGLS